MGLSVKLLAGTAALLVLAGTKERMHALWARIRKGMTTVPEGETIVTEITAADAYRDFLTDLQGGLVAQTRHVPELRKVIADGRVTESAPGYNNILEFRTNVGSCFRLSFRAKCAFALELPGKHVDGSDLGIPPGSRGEDCIGVTWCQSQEYGRLYEKATWDCLSAFALHAVLFAWAVLGGGDANEDA